MLRRSFIAIATLVALAHVALFLGAGGIARAVLADRTLDGERQTEGQWVDLLHGMVLRSSLVMAAVIGLCFALARGRRTGAALRAFFTARASPFNLAVFRVAFFATFFVVFDVEQITFFARLPPALVQGLSDPLPLWRLLIPAPSLTPALARLFLGCCFLGMIGLLTRAAALSACLLGFYLLGLPQVYGKVDHYHHLLWFSLLLAVSPSGDALGVDALWRRRRGEPAPAPSVAYTLPLRLVWVLFGVMYFWPGFWKLVQHGPAWVLSDNFKAHLYLKWFEDETFRPAFRVDRHPWLCHAAAGAAIVFEVGFIFLVPFRRTRPFAVVAGLAFHNLTFLVMNISFLSLQVCYAAFVDWEGAIAWMGRRAAAMGEGPGGARDERTAARRLLAVGLALVGVNTLYGAAHQSDAWPFACYPTFSSLIRFQYRSLLVRVVTPEGERPARSLLEAFRSERYAAVVRGIVRERREPERRRKLEALAQVVRGLDPALQPGDTIVIDEAVFSTDPDEARRPQREERRGAFQLDRGGGLVEVP